jgi:hypothetical protein
MDPLQPMVASYCPLHRGDLVVALGFRPGSFSGTRATPAIDIPKANADDADPVRGQAPRSSCDSAPDCRRFQPEVSCNQLECDRFGEASPPGQIHA